MADPLATRRPVIRGAIHLAAIGLLAVALRVVYGPGFVGIDAMWSLAWAEDLIEHGWLVESATTTPHVLSNLLGLVLLPFGNDADRALVAIDFLGAATLVWCVAAAARAIAGTPAGLIAGLVMATQEQLLFATRSAYLDVFAAMLVAAAGLVAVRGQGRRWVAAGALLALAGLLRPEPWVLLVLLALWRWRADGRPSAALLAFVIAVPLLWAVTDWQLSDDPLYSLHQTRAASERFRELSGIDEGIVQRLASIPKSELRAAGPAGVVLGGIAALLAFWPGPGGARLRTRWLGAAGADDAAPLRMLRILLGAAAGLLLTVAAEAVTGTLLFARFSLPAAALLVAAGVSVAVLVVRVRLPAARSPIALAAGAAALLVIAVPLLAKARSTTDPEQARYEAARAILRPGVPCAPLVVPSAELVPQAAVWTDVWVGNVVDAMVEGVPRSGSYVDATTADGQLLSRGGWTTVKVPDLATLPVPVVREQRGWILRAGSRVPTATATCSR